jgi:hypothetical protein
MLAVIKNKVHLISLKPLCTLHFREFLFPFFIRTYRDLPQQQKQFDLPVGTKRQKALHLAV